MRVSSFLLTASLLAGALPAHGQATEPRRESIATSPPPVAPSRISRIDERVVDSLVNAEIAAHQLVGLSVALVRGGRVELVKGYGVASADSHTPVDTATRFSIGSVTKQFVVALTLLLQEDGRLSVHDPVAKWYPGLTRAREITLLDLLNHVSGYRDFYPLDFVDREMAQATTAERIIREYATQPLDFDPGTRWSYSNTGFMILGRVLERVSGQPLGTLLETRIFRPLGMRQTVFEPTKPERLASGFTRWALGDPEPIAPEASGWTGAAGGIWSTAADLARWDLALMRPGFLRPASRAVLFGERVLRDSSSTGYAGGLGLSRDSGRTVFSHGGATSGYSASNVFIPDDTAAVVLLSNLDFSAVSTGSLGAPLLRLVSPPRPSATAAPARKQARVKPPTPAGATPLTAALDFFGALQHGSVDRSQLSADYAVFLTPSRVSRAAATLAPLGDVTRAELLDLWERGGMQVSTARLTTAARSFTTIMYRAPSGAIEEFLIW